MLIYRSFISFTKWELKTYVLLGIFSEVKSLLGIMSLLGVIVFLVGVTDLKTSFSSSLAIFFSSSTCIKDTYTRDTCFAISAYVKSTCIWVIFIKSAWCIGDICFRGVSIGGIYGSAHKPSESSLECSRLLSKLISKMSVSFCLHLWTILGRVLYYCFIYLIYLIIYLSFQLALTAFSIVVI